MTGIGWFLIIVAIVVAGVLSRVWRPLRRRVGQHRLADAQRLFHLQRERLEAKFVELATGPSHPVTADWIDCDFDDGVAYVRSRQSGRLSAFVAVTALADQPGHSLSPRAERPGNLRDATAVFFFDGQGWDTEGRLVINLRPAEVIRFYRDDLEVVGRERAGRAGRNTIA